MNFIWSKLGRIRNRIVFRGSDSDPVFFLTGGPGTGSCFFSWSGSTPSGYLSHVHEKNVHVFSWWWSSYFIHLFCRTVRACSSSVRRSGSSCRIPWRSSAQTSTRRGKKATGYPANRRRGVYTVIQRRPRNHMQGGPRGFHTLIWSTVSETLKLCSK